MLSGINIYPKMAAHWPTKYVQEDILYVELSAKFSRVVQLRGWYVVS